MSVLWRVGSQVNKFQQVSTDDHMMSVTRGRGSCPGLMSERVGYPAI